VQCFSLKLIGQEFAFGGFIQKTALMCFNLHFCDYEEVEPLLSTQLFPATDYLLAP
jgi:hypothetical protein